jgi:hypothetical protein
MTQSRFVLQVNWRSDFVYDERFFMDVFDQDIMHVWIARNSHTYELMGYGFIEFHTLEKMTNAALKLINQYHMRVTELPH